VAGQACRSYQLGLEWPLRAGVPHPTGEESNRVFAISQSSDEGVLIDVIFWLQKQYFHIAQFILQNKNQHLIILVC
jgi:hypothetical protein